ncbi:MAG: aminoglycoside phosphotransferase family protein [Gammaproteobacteria bacterium]|nr:aminoglycoside phosphotransferase family protein [Gammaproteobacteria bacterium]
MQTLEKNMIALYGEKGKQWFADLPQLRMQSQTAYGLSDLRSFKNLSFNDVLSGFQGQQAIVLKLGLDSDGLKREAMALRAFAGCGVVNVLAEEDGLLLLECAVPGVSLNTYFPEKDAAAITITATLIKQLHKAPIPPDHAFPHIKDWLPALDQDWEIPVDIMQKAKQLRDGLLASAPPDVLLHGDLHHDNVLQQGEAWVVIDPKGVMGDPAYDVTPFIRNPMPALLEEDIAADMIQQRISYFADLLAVPRQRVLDWCFVTTVLSWTWALEDGCDTDYYKNLTRVFE